MFINSIQRTLGFRGTAENYSAEALVGKKVCLDNNWQKKLDKSEHSNLPKDRQNYTVVRAQHDRSEIIYNDTDGKLKTEYRNRVKLQVKDDKDNSYKNFNKCKPLTREMFDVVEDNATK